MEDMPDFEKESREKLRWYVANFPSPHHFFGPAMAALEKKEAEEIQRASQPAIQITGSNVANINLGSQIGAMSAHASSYTVPEFNDQIRQVVRIAKLEWSLLNRPGQGVSDQTVCKRVDELRLATVLLYGKCPRGTDSVPLRKAIEKLDDTRQHRLGNNIGSPNGATEVCRLMEAALADLAGTVPDAFE
jgi:hypothetical protein